MLQEAEVRAGIALLDEKKTGWREKFDPATLDMSSPFLCVLGQVDGYYPRGFEDLFGEFPAPHNVGIAYSHGFVVSPDAFDDHEKFQRSSSELTDTWIDLVRPSQPN